MVAHTVLLDFTVSSNAIVDSEKRSNLKSTIANVLKEHFVGLKLLTESYIDGSLLVLYTGPRSSLITIRGYPEGLITINIEYYKRDDENALLTFEVTIKIRENNIKLITDNKSLLVFEVKNLGGKIEYFFLK